MVALGHTYTQSINEHTQESLSITPHRNIQLKLAKLKVFLLSSDRRGLGGACIAKKIYLSQLAIQQIIAFSKPGRKHTHTWGQNLNFFLLKAKNYFTKS
jgi:hypothetical protein